MRDIRGTTQALLVVAALVVACAAHAEPLSEVWFEATLVNAPVGYSHATVVVRDDGAIVTTVESDFTMRRGDEVVSVRGTDEWVETDGGTPVSYSQTRKMAIETLELDVTVEPEGLRLRKSDGRDAVFSTLENQDGLLFPRAVEVLHASKGFVTGSEYSYLAFDPDFHKISVFDVRVVGPENLEIMGETRELFRLVVVPEVYDGVEVLEWRDREGRLWREEIPSFETSLQRTTEDVASREREAGDILAVSMIESNCSIAVPHTVDDALYEVWVDGGDVTEVLIEDSRQVVEGTTERGVLLRVRRMTPEEGTTVIFPIRSTPLKDYLDGNPIMQTWYPRLLGTAARSVWGAQQDTWQGAMQIERWVYDNIDNKGMGTAFASAWEVMERLSGDCSEHAVLMAAMCRAVGIPAKLASGVVHYQGEFAYHMWVEVWTGENWFALDPTVGAGSADATHIKLAESSVPGGSVAELSLGIMKVFNRLGIRVVEYTVGENTVRPAGR